MQMPTDLLPVVLKLGSLLSEGIGQVSVRAIRYIMGYPAADASQDLYLLWMRYKHLGQLSQVRVKMVTPTTPIPAEKSS